MGMTSQQGALWSFCKQVRIIVSEAQVLSSCCMGEIKDIMLRARLMLHMPAPSVAPSVKSMARKPAGPLGMAMASCSRQALRCDVPILLAAAQAASAPRWASCTTGCRTRPSAAA